MTRADMIADRFHRARERLTSVMESRGWKATWNGEFEREGGCTMFPESVDLKTGEVTIKHGRWLEDKGSFFGVRHEELSREKVSLVEFERMANEQL